MKKVKYALEKSGDFIIENYNYAKAFSSFFPGIAGLYGIPLWAFYVNRGQCVTSFGVRNKDGSILEFHPANQAYYITPAKGFRTFIKMHAGGRQIVYEPFRENGFPYTQNATSWMIINPYKLELIESNPDLGLMINVLYMTVPEEPFAGIARRVTLKNISGSEIRGDMIDGLPQIIPYGMTDWHQKHMSRTIEAWIQVANTESGIPFYALKVNPQDKPELEYVDRGNFFLAYELSGDKAAQLKAIIDPDIVFGRDGDINYPNAYAEKEDFAIPRAQRTDGKTPSAFSYKEFAIKPNESVTVISVIGNTDTAERINKRKDILLKPGFFTEKLERNADIIKRLENAVFTKSSSDEFDFYIRQIFLDNLLRGGYPYSLPTSKGPFVFYLYARKHGDLERDYNTFMLPPSYFSQGNGAFRDINQNRRSDILINPEVREDNVRTFINAIQPDGFNPLLVEGLSLSVRKNEAFSKALRAHIRKRSDRDKTEGFLSSEFTPGGLITFIEKEEIGTVGGVDNFLKEILALVHKDDVIRPGEGYWVDHWTYNLDLIENYFAVYPEKFEELLIGENDFTFYDTYHKVLPRDEKYVYIDDKIRQFGSVVEDEGKRRLIESRSAEPRKVRTQHGKGGVYRTTLFVKLLNLIANKIASLDPFGIGIEMEANKPGWCDSLNNLPGIFGSSVAETAELKRLIIFTLNTIDKLHLPASHGIDMPVEMADFIKGLSNALKANFSSESSRKDYIYWDDSAELKEEYREKVWMGFAGKKKALAIKAVRAFLESAIKKADAALRRSFDKKTGIPFTYFMHEATRFEFVEERGKTKLSRRGEPIVKVSAFKNKPLSHFLEGPMHMMKVIENPGARMRLYDAIKESALYDKKLRMYKINAPLTGMPYEIGRSTIFTPGWLENESIWLHMEYKYLLELLRGGLYDQFFNDMKTALVAFMDPAVYGRSILENSSFIASSAHPDPEIHGNGFVARLTGSTTEFVSMWLMMAVGANPLRLNEHGELNLKFEPILPEWLFTREEKRAAFYFSHGAADEVLIPKDCFAFAFLGKTLVIYHNPKRRNTYGKDAVLPVQIRMRQSGEEEVIIAGDTLPPRYAEAVRNGYFERIEVTLG